MEDQTPMSSERFLSLLNNGNRTPDEETELQNELIRQNNAQQAAVAQEEVTETPAQEAAEETPAPTEPNVAPVEEPAAPVEPAAEVPDTTTAEAAPVDQTPPAPYSLAQLGREVQDAVTYLQGYESRTLAVEMATCAFLQAEYWIRLANEGK